MARDHLLAIDQGTTSTRAVVYDRRLRPVGQGQAEVPPTYPQSGWVEHDPAALVASVGPLVAPGPGRGGDRGRPDRGHRPDQPARDDRRLGPRGPAGRSARPWSGRTAGPPTSASGTATAATGSPSGPGLVLDPYFSATKIAWLLDHVPDARRRAEAGELAAGTVDSLLIWHLTGGRRHVTDATNASRTLLMDLRTLEWADDLCDFFARPRGNIARNPARAPASSAGRSGFDYLPDGLPIAGVAGDQQASLVGQGCLAAGPGQVHLRHRGLPAGPHRRDRSSPRRGG